MAEETESVVNDATMLADMETVEESLQQGLENLMDEMEEVADVEEPREGKEGRPLWLNGIIYSWE